MEQTVLKQLDVVRKITINEVEGLSEETLNTIPDGFNNNIRWNLGHIYLVQEKFAFYFAGEPMQVPESFDRLFGRGTSPSDWSEELPKLDVLLQMLEDQPKRIQETFQNRLSEQVKEPFTTRSGVTLSTIGEFVNFTMYHEGMHVSAIKLLKRFAEK
ncbi:DinB family protein [Anaerobacillus sp. MEB173]|uniref:DinB family protein n=1 Tax=Anaerobacillus sp. MEB173 TaxID=3383345 RepID=UPI003F93E5A8